MVRIHAGQLAAANGQCNGGICLRLANILWAGEVPATPRKGGTAGCAVGNAANHLYGFWATQAIEFPKQLKLRGEFGFAQRIEFEFEFEFEFTPAAILERGEQQPAHGPDEFP